MKNIQQTCKRAFLSCMLLLSVVPLEFYAAAAYVRVAANDQELLNKMATGQRLTDQEIGIRDRLKRHILDLGVNNAHISESVEQILSTMTLDQAFSSIKNKGTLTPLLAEYLSAVLVTITKSEQLDVQEIRSLDDYDASGNYSPLSPEETAISSSVNIHNNDAGRCVAFLGEEDKRVIGFEAILLKESGLLRTLAEDKETKVLSINKMLTHISLEELYFVLETVANSTKESLYQYLASKSEAELIKIANTAHYLDIHKLYEAVTDRLADIIAEDNTPATTFAQIFFDSGTSITGSMKKNTQEELQAVLPEDIIDDIARKIGFKFTGKYIDTTVEDQKKPYSSFSKESYNSPDGKFRISLDFYHFKPARIISNESGKLIHTLDWIQLGSYEDYAAAWSTDSKKFSLGSRNGVVGIFQADTWECIQTLVGHTKYVNKTIWSTDGLLLASTSTGDGTVRIWNTITGKLLRTLETSATQIDFSPNNRYLASTSIDGKINIWDISTGKLIQTLVFENPSIDFVKNFILLGTIFKKPEILEIRISWLPKGLKFYLRQELRYTEKVYERSGPYDNIRERDATKTWEKYYICESETFEQKQERVYRLIQRAAIAAAKQTKSEPSRSCIIN